MVEKIKRSTSIWITLNLVFFFAMLGINYLGSTGFFNGMGQKDVSDKYTTLLTPAGFAFSIWGVIYTLILISLIYFFVKRKEIMISQLINEISPLFILSCILNMGWIIAFSYEKVGLSTLFILGMVVVILLIVEKIYKSREEIPYTLTGIAFTLYGAWVFIASILNVAIFLVQQNWGGFGIPDSVWAMIMIIVAIVLTLSYLLLYKNAVFPISLAWAFWGIYNSYSSGSIKSSMDEVIQTMLLIGIGIFIVAIIITFIKNKFAIFPKSNA
ncbi:TspO/MBR family protein [Phocicoccus pinnipedialis]|uniref:Tryptophan-rich sensory protein n=1 Tax=Phocicoccus pinnipedialis TaxID=110845 RepID=A0A6V7RPJ7_9BACL|nr:TspO/MBR family protein [Jeotgalicoccus pinnipedialis]MBP1940231.1 hypothetical protein [Jeotgalicoccus pinnipedialis]CAD2079588.1 hypothetical protein JEOPIN946_01595 [Jeotgalicoccus pinnipedialis]